MTVYLDFETRSEVDVSEVGAYKYWRHPTTEILCLQYQIDDRKVKLWVPGFSHKDNQIPFDLQARVASTDKFKAVNANFEIQGWNERLVKEYGWPTLSLGRWRCIAVKGAMYSLPRGLEKMALALGLQEQKDSAGHNVMLQLCKPRAPSKHNTDKFFSDDERFNRLYSYCGQDVVTAHAIDDFLKPINEDEWYNWFMDQEINTRGIAVDVEALKAAQEINVKLDQKAKKKIHKLTDGFVSSPTEIQKIKKWTAKQGVQIDSMAAPRLPEILADKKVPKRVKRVVKLRADNNKSSNAKIKRMLDYVNEDGRIHDYLLFYGAHTGRWTGTGPQTTNLPVGSLKYPQVVQAIKAIKRRDIDALRTFGNPLDVISSCIRGFFCAPRGRELICGDYASIEAGLVLWLAGEKDAVNQMLNGRDIYKELAAVIHNKPIDQITKEERGHGKRGILGGGYGMGWKRLRDDAKDKYGVILSDEISQKIINAYREKYWRVPKLWKALEKAAIDAVYHKRMVKVEGIEQDIRYKKQGRFLLCRLPSGRVLTYYRPKLSLGKYDKLQLSYMGVNSTTYQFTKKYTWGGVFCENDIQSMARDAMVHGMRQINNSPKYDVLLNVYDEILAECDKGTGDVAEYARLATQREDWSRDAPIIMKQKDCWIGKRYRKG